MLLEIQKYVSCKYNLKSELSIDLKIKSDNVLDEILVTTSEDIFKIKYDDLEIISSKETIYKDLSYILDHLAYIYFLTFEGKEISHITYDALTDETIIDKAENFIWNNRDNKLDEIDRIFVVSFRNLYSFEAKASGSFIDTYWQIYDEPHYMVYDTAWTRFKYRDKAYADKYRSLLTMCINNKYNMEALRHYFLREGYCYLLDWKDEDTHDVYQLIDIDLDTLKMIAGNSFALMSSDYKSILDYEDGKIYIRGIVEENFKTIKKIIQVDDLPCTYIHSIKTSRIEYNGKIYEASGKTISEELNKLNKLLDNKILCCLFCKYGNYIDDPNKIYCLKGFKPRDLADVIYYVEETKMLAYDMFNLCEDFNFQTKKFYTHTNAIGENDE